jgi:lipoate---protein ligase
MGSSGSMALSICSFMFLTLSWANMNVFVSPFRNPFINLALEDHFLRGGADLPLLLFYVNRPCVVLGRFQNPWLECHLHYLVKNDIWLVRRQSGGGCVFHDEGNLNYSFIYPEGMIDRRRGVELIQKAFQKADIPLEISSRHDLWLDGKKISGSAFKQTKDASFHHGTFLVSSDLSRLEESLKHTIIAKETKSIASVRSKVITLNEKFPGITIEDVMDLITHELKTVKRELDASLLSLPEVQESFKNLTKWEWMWGETPLFEMNDFKVHKGMIKEPFEARFEATSLKGKISGDELDRLFPDFTLQYQTQQQVF